MLLTIFTPTYNRSDELAGLYKSMISALAHCDGEDAVEWLIVDDGSETDLRPVIDGFKPADRLRIRFLQKENGGKHTAFNLAIEACEGDLFVCIDDDDRLTENALADIFSLGCQLGTERAQNGYGAFVGRVVNEKGEKLGTGLQKYPTVSNTIEIRDRYKFWGEPEVYFTDILKKYRFDVFEGERFLTEAYLFDRMSAAHPFYYTDRPLMVKKYLPDGLTANQTKIRIESPRGTERYYFQRWRMCRGFRFRLKAAINCIRFSYWIEKERPARAMGVYGLLAAPVAALMYRKDRKMYLAAKEKKQ